MDSSDAMDFEDAVACVPFLRTLPAAEIARLRRAARVREVGRGQRIWDQGEATSEFLFLVAGRARLVKASEAGREVIVDVCAAGELLCANAACSAAPYCCTSMPMDTAFVVAIPRRELFELLDRCPGASRSFVAEVARRGAGLTHRIEQLSSGHVERRIASLFLRLADRVGEPFDGDDATWIPVALSRQNLADLCGTTLETTIRVMTRLARENLVRTVGRGFHVPDRARLEALVRGD